MFSNKRQKKLKNKVIIAAIAVVVMTFGIWLNYQDRKGDEADQAANKVRVEESTIAPEPIKDAEVEAETGTNDNPETYLIKVEDGVVKVFLCDSEGNRELYLITSVPFDLLSESDQQLFIDGVRLETEEDLGSFLENFDS